MSYKIKTKCVQSGYYPQNGEPRQMPIIQSTTFKYSTSDQMGRLFDLEESGYFYTRLQNPTNDYVAAKIADLEGGTAAMLTSSGQAANFFALFNICECGDHIVSSASIYGGTFNLISVTMAKMGIEVTFVSPDCTEDELNAAFKDNTKVVFGETIANPALTVLDIEKFAKAAHAHGVPLVVDNTFPTPVNCRPIEWGADIVTCLDTPPAEELALVKRGATLIGRMNPWGKADDIETFEQMGITALAMDAVPRISRAQSLDVRSSMMNVGGYRAVIEAAIEVSRDKGILIHPEIMIPLVGEVKELKYVKDFVVKVADELIAAAGSDYAEQNRNIQKARQDLEDAQAERNALGGQQTGIDDAKTALDEARAAFDAAEERRTGVQKQLQALGEQIDALRGNLDEFSDKHHRSELQLARVEGEFKQIQDRIWEDYELTYAGAEPFRQPDFKLTESEKRIAAIRQRIRAMGTVNVAALDEYRRTVERVEELTSQRDDLLKAQADLEGIVAELETKMEKQFKEQFALMNENFQRTFVRLFGGGKAELRLSDPKDALNCGIDIVAQPPGKKLQMLSLLSGGERALTAIAILFAILDLKPTPFCILDEIEAALDDANIDTYADYLKAYSENTQFIVITHRKGTMERCDALYGVVMEEKGVSKTVSVKLNEAV